MKKKNLKSSERKERKSGFTNIQSVQGGSILWDLRWSMDRSVATPNRGRCSFERSQCARPEDASRLIRRSASTQVICNPIDERRLPVCTGNLYRNKHVRPRFHICDSVHIYTCLASTSVRDLRKHTPACERRVRNLFTSRSIGETSWASRSSISYDKLILRTFIAMMILSWPNVYARIIF